jgi:DNA-directed RNA polymerase subunit K/omega
MSQFRKPFYTQINPSVTTRSLDAVGAKTGNLYESICVISKRATQITTQVKEELHGKLNDFSSMADTLEEILENREQIEISRFYEKLPEPTIIATKEFLENKIFFQRKHQSPDSVAVDSVPSVD